MTSDITKLLPSEILDIVVNYARFNLPFFLCNKKLYNLYNELFTYSLPRPSISFLTFLGIDTSFIKCKDKDMYISIGNNAKQVGKDSITEETIVFSLDDYGLYLNYRKNIKRNTNCWDLALNYLVKYNCIDIYHSHVYNYYKNEWYKNEQDYDSDKENNINDFHFFDDKCKLKSFIICYMDVIESVNNILDTYFFKDSSNLADRLINFVNEFEINEHIEVIKLVFKFICDKTEHVLVYFNDFKMSQIFNSMVCINLYPHDYLIPFNVGDMDLENIMFNIYNNSLDAKIYVCDYIKNYSNENNDLTFGKYIEYILCRKNDNYKKYVNYMGNKKMICELIYDMAPNFNEYVGDNNFISLLHKILSGSYDFNEEDDLIYVMVISININRSIDIILDRYISQNNISQIVSSKGIDELMHHNKFNLHNWYKLFDMVISNKNCIMKRKLFNIKNILMYNSKIFNHITINYNDLAVDCLLELFNCELEDLLNKKKYHERIVKIIKKMKYKDTSEINRIILIVISYDFNILEHFYSLNKQLIYTFYENICKHLHIHKKYKDNDLRYFQFAVDNDIKIDTLTLFNYIESCEILNKGIYIFKIIHILKDFMDFEIINKEYTIECIDEEDLKNYSNEKIIKYIENFNILILTKLPMDRLNEIITILFKDPGSESCKNLRLLPNRYILDDNCVYMSQVIKLKKADQISPHLVVGNKHDDIYVDLEESMDRMFYFLLIQLKK